MSIYEVQPGRNRERINQQVQTMSDDADDDPDAVPPDDPRSEGTARAPVETEWQRIGPELSADDLEAIGTRAINRVMAHTRIDFYLWVQCFAALHYLRLKDDLTTEQYYAVAQRMGVSERDARRCKHITPEMLPDITKFGEVESRSDRMRRKVQAERARWPTLGDIIRKFPAPAIVSELATLPPGAKEDQTQAEERAANVSAAQARKMARESSDQLVQQRQSAADAIRQKDVEIEQQRARADAAEQALQRAREELANSIESHATEIARLKAELEAARHPRDAVNNNSPDVETPDPPTAAPHPPPDPDSPTDAEAAAPSAPDPDAPDPTHDPDPVDPPHPLDDVPPDPADRPPSGDPPADPPPTAPTPPDVYVLTDCKRDLEPLQELEKVTGVQRWRGQPATSVGRQIRADFLSTAIDRGDIIPAALLTVDCELWKTYAGRTYDDIRARYLRVGPDDDDPDPKPPEPDQPPPPAAPEPPDPPPSSPSEPPVPPSDAPREPEPPELALPPTDARADNVVPLRPNFAPDPKSPRTPDERNPDDPEPEPDSAPPVDPELAAIRAVYAAIRHVETVTCELLADVLRQFPMHDWDEADREHLAEQIQGMADWECAPLAHALVTHEESLKLFATVESVLTYDDEHGLRIRRWTDVETELAPQLADDKRRYEQRRREDEGRRIISSRLPRVRKLKAMQQRINRLLELGPQISDEGQRAIDFIRAMKGDDPVFADCTTFNVYIERASNITKPIDT